jgi:hypothetical protein
MQKKSVFAVCAGVLVVIGVTTLVDVVLRMLDVYPTTDKPLDDRLSLIATSYRVVIGVIGAWVTARLAPDQPFKHAMYLGYAGFALALLGAIVTWNMGLAPRWYPIVVAVLPIPQAWVGGKLFERQSAPQPRS